MDCVLALETHFHALNVCMFMCLVPEFKALYYQEETYDSSHKRLEFISAGCYDHIWVASLALNCTDTYLKSTGNFDIGFAYLRNVYTV